MYIGEEPIGLTLFEMTEATEMQYVGNSTYVPVSSLSPAQLRRYEQSRYWTTTQERASRRLRLQAYCPAWRVTWVTQWSEAKPGLFASMVPDIIRELEAAGPRLAAQVEAARTKAEEERRKWEEDERRRREAEARALQEKRRQEARVITEYFAEVERAAQQLDGDARQRLLHRVALAKDLVGNDDPMDQLLCRKAPGERG